MNEEKMRAAFKMIDAIVSKHVGTREEHILLVGHLNAIKELIDEKFAKKAKKLDE